MLASPDDDNQGTRPLAQWLECDYQPPVVVEDDDGDLVVLVHDPRHPTNFLPSPDPLPFASFLSNDDDEEEDS